MTQEDKEILLKDISARLSYGVICKVNYKDSEGYKTDNMALDGMFTDECYFTCDKGSIYSSDFKPYLRPMSSMTEEEEKEFNDILEGIEDGEEKWDKPNFGDDTDWLNTHHFDYRGLIEKGLAIEATEGMYKSN